MDPETKSLNFIFPTKYVIPKSLKFSNWLSQEGTQIFDLTEFLYCRKLPILKGPKGGLYFGIPRVRFQNPKRANATLPDSIQIAEIKPHGVGI